MPDYIVLEWPGIVVSAGDLAIWAGILAAILATATFAAAHVRNGGSLRDDVRAARRPS